LKPQEFAGQNPTGRQSVFLQEPCRGNEVFPVKSAKPFRQEYVIQYATGAGLPQEAQT
jgi:hypothetical protein